jgi:hypothetical protein
MFAVIIASALHTCCLVAPSGGRTLTLDLGVAVQEQHLLRSVYAFQTVVWCNCKSALLIMHMICHRVKRSILKPSTIFYNIFNSVLPQNSTDSMWTVPWNPYGIVHGFAM